MVKEIEKEERDKLLCFNLFCPTSFFIFSASNRLLVVIGCVSRDFSPEPKSIKIMA